MSDEKKPPEIKVTDTRASAQPDASEAVKGPGWEMKPDKKEAEEPKPSGRGMLKMDFTTFCLSLASSALIHLGVSPSPETGKTEKDLALARQTVDILEMLEVKTRNNLSDDEARLISAVLYDLRLRFVEALRT